MELTKLKGIGEKTAEAFNRLGIFSAEDLVKFYPRAYESFDKPVPLYELVPGKTMTVEGVLSKDASINHFKGMTIVNAYLADMTGRLQLSWYNSPFIRSSLKAGAHLIFRGRVYEKNGKLIMNQPKLYQPEAYKEKYEGRLQPVYPLGKGISNNTIVKAVAEALTKCSRANEFLPESIIDEYGLKSLDVTAIRLHFPRDNEELAASRRRAVFDEFFLEHLAGLRLSQNAKSIKSSYVCRPDFRLIRFIADLPFELTKGQLKAYKEINADLSSGRVMNRLIEGDVGSGKTMVAVLAMLSAALNGYQAAIMAPTAVLAAQHYETFNRLLESNGGFEGKVSTVLLTGSMTAAEKREALKRIRTHEANIIIGTHALFQESVEYDALGLIVTDEQHRFGVGQRAALSDKGSMPHTLVMSATPIPRTLAIIMYSSMDISMITERPEGRIPIKNCVVGPSYRPTAYKFIFDEIKKGRQAYIICPAIEETDEDGSEESSAGGFAAAGADARRHTEHSEASFTSPNPHVNEAAASKSKNVKSAPGAAQALENVTDYTAKLKKLCPEGIRVEMLHGRLKNDEKDAVMQRFKAHETDILVSTTVIEVGVDVPNATVIMIENAERFGLAELHQLRGRVGRGSYQSYCIMINTSETDKAAERLAILNSSNDGFKIAEEDLRLRGPGDVFGVKQSGETEYRIADIYRDADILKEAAAAASKIMKKDPELENPEHQRLRRISDEYLEKGYIV